MVDGAASGRGRRRARSTVAAAAGVAALVAVAAGLGSLPDPFRLDRAVGAALSPVPPSGAALTLLVVGTDDRRPAAPDPRAPAGERADAVVLVHVPAHGPPRGLSLPRDLLVDLEGVGPQKLAAALELGGPPLLVRAVRGLTGLAVHHYAEVDFAGFAAAVDRLGGVTVELDTALRDPYAGLDEPAGARRLDGAAALAFVRARNVEEWREGEWVPAGGGDLGRIRRQHQLLGAVLAAATDAPTLDAARWLAEARDHVVVDRRLTPARARRLARRLVAGGEGPPELATLPSAPTADEARWSPFSPGHPGTMPYLMPSVGAPAAVAGLVAATRPGP